jgi:hypothetical protein
MSGSGLSALIRLGASLENDWGMEAIACGRGALADEDCVLEICGRWLAFRIALHGPEVRTAACLMDAADPPETLLRSPDTEAGWDTAQRLIASGVDGDAWVIA